MKSVSNEHQIWDGAMPSPVGQHNWSLKGANHEPIRLPPALSNWVMVWRECARSPGVRKGAQNGFCRLEVADQ